MTGHVISAWSAVSPYGIGATPFMSAVADTPATPVRLDPAAGEVPEPLAYRVPDFDIRDVLGRKGTRSMDGVSALAVTAVRELLDAQERNRAVATGTEVALVLGTTTGSVQSTMDITRDTHTQEKPFYIDAARIPNAILNGAAAQCAIWHQLLGPNTTVAGGRAAGFFALRYARALLDSQRAATVLCGAAEEFSPARAWLEHHSRDPGEPGAMLGEGAAMMLLEPAGRAGAPVLAELLAVEVGVYSGRNPTAGLAACICRALARADVAVEEVWAVSSAPAAGRLGDAELAAIDEVFAQSRPLAVPDGQRWGDAGAVTVPFQIAAVLSAARHSPDAAGRCALVTSVDRDGVLGCALLRTSGGGGR